MAKTTTAISEDYGLWSVAGSWDNGAPAAGDTVIIPEGTSITVDALCSLAALTIAGDVAFPVPLDYVAPTPGQVLEGVDYGAHGTEFTGTLIAAPASSAGAGLFNGTCTIRRGTRTADGYATGPTWADLATGVLCRLLVLDGGGREVVVGKALLVSTHAIMLPYNQALEFQDQIVTGGNTYDVLYIPPANPNWGGRFKRAELRLVD